MTCDCCGADVKRVEPLQGPGGGTYACCDLCVNTVTSASWRAGFPESQVHRTICYVGNVILAALRAQNKAFFNAEHPINQ